MRLFIAVNFDDAILDAIEGAIGAFPIARPPWRWAARGTWHITLKFLGDTPAESVDRLGDILQEVARRHDPFEMTLSGFDGFPNLFRPRVLFYAAERGAEELAALSGDINGALAERAGVRAETKPFRAHATVARIKTRIGRPAAEALRSIPSLEGAVQTVAAFDLMESQLGPKGSKYTLLKRFALGNSA